MHPADIRTDLELTVRELSDTYEELSLLYKLLDRFSGMDVDEISEHVVEETLNTLAVKTSALLFTDENNEQLYTKSFRGKWDKNIIITREDKIIWDAIDRKKPIAFCKLSDAGYTDYAYAENSILVCPLVGKAKVLGALILADRISDNEFYSNDIKLITAITSHAALSIENAMLYVELEEFLLSAIKSLVKALEASSRWTAGHTERVTACAIGLGEVMELPKQQLERLNICSLLHDIGKIAVSKDILDKRDALTSEEETEIKRHPIIGAEILDDVKQLQDVVLGIKYHHEFWDGSNSLVGLKGEAIPLIARILAVADSFDAMISDRPYRKCKLKDEAIREIEEQSGKQFDPVVVQAFMKWVSLQHQASSP
jgi:putative nucleotidyltransferase with HDIG domain